MNEPYYFKCTMCAEQHELENAMPDGGGMRGFFSCDKAPQIEPCGPDDYIFTEGPVEGGFEIWTLEGDWNAYEQAVAL